MMLVDSSGSSTVFAGTNQRFAATGVVGIGEPGNADAPEEDTQSPKSDGTDGTTQAPDTTTGQPSGDTAPEGGQPSGDSTPGEAQPSGGDAPLEGQPSGVPEYGDS